MKESLHVIARNRKATFDYELLERFEAGIVLTGTEVKSLRDGKASLQEAYARLREGEMWIINMDIPAYKNAAVLFNHEPKRKRKLLLKHREINKLTGKVEQRGFTLIPTQLYFKNGWAKIEIALARGKAKHDKRESLRAKEAEREIRRHTRR